MTDDAFERALADRDARIRAEQEAQAKAKSAARELEAKLDEAKTVFARLRGKLDTVANDLNVVLQPKGLDLKPPSGMTTVRRPYVSSSSLHLTEGGRILGAFGIALKDDASFEFTGNGGGARFTFEEASELTIENLTAKARAALAGALARQAD